MRDKTGDERNDAVTPKELPKHDDAAGSNFRRRLYLLRTSTRSWLRSNEELSYANGSESCSESKDSEPLIERR